MAAPSLSYLWSAYNKSYIAFSRLWSLFPPEYAALGVLVVAVALYYSLFQKYTIFRHDGHGNLLRADILTWIVSTVGILSLPFTPYQLDLVVTAAIMYHNITAARAAQHWQRSVMFFVSVLAEVICIATSLYFNAL